MVPSPSDLYDDDVEARVRWALREGVVLGGILVFWVAAAVVVTVVAFIVSLPLVVVGGGPTGFAVISLVWTVVGPLTAANAAVYVLARVGVLLLDRYRDADAGAHALSTDGTRDADEASDAGADADGGEAAETEAESEGDEPNDDGASAADEDGDAGEESDAEEETDGDAGGEADESD